MEQGTFRKYLNILIMHALALLMLACLFSLSSAHEVLVVRSADIKPYNDAIAGFSSTCGCSITVMPLSDIEKNSLLRKAGQGNYDAVFAAGMDALMAARAVSNIPVVYAVVSDHPETAMQNRNFSGVSMQISADIQIDAVRSIFPSARHVGIVYNPAVSENLVREIRTAAKAHGLELIAKAADRPNELAHLLREMNGAGDIFLMLPDAGMLNPENLDQIFLFSFRNRVPVFSFSKKYLDMGAAAAVVTDAYELGRQAGRIMKNQLSAGRERTQTLQQPAGHRLLINRKIAEKLNLSIPADIQEVRGDR